MKQTMFDWRSMMAKLISRLW